MKRFQKMVDSAVSNMKRENSETALQAIIELMLTDFKTDEVVSKLRAWADYLEDRT